MTSNSKSDSGVEDHLGQYLEQARGDAVADAATVDALFDGVRARIDETRRNPLWWLRRRSTAVRRAIALTSFGALVFLAFATGLRADWAAYPTSRMVLFLGSTGVLLAVALSLALRPLHVRALSARAGFGLALVAVGATVVLAALPAAHGPVAPNVTLPSDMTCMYAGLLLGLPVYLVARALDRGASLAPLLAACAAGLSANFVLQLHCPAVDPTHNLLGHASVCVVFVGAIAILELMRRRRGAAGS